MLSRAGFAVRISVVALGGVLLAAAPLIVLLIRSHRISAANPSLSLLRAPATTSALVIEPVVAPPPPAVVQVVHEIRTEAKPSLVLAKVGRDSAILRAGPGQQYRRLGSLAINTELSVKNVIADWVEVNPPAGLIVQEPPAHGYWVRKDLVRLAESGGVGKQ